MSRPGRVVAVLMLPIPLDAVGRLADVLSRTYGPGLVSDLSEADRITIRLPDEEVGAT